MPAATPPALNRSMSNKNPAHDMNNPWLALTLKTFQLGLEAQTVVALRMLRLASGDIRGQEN